MSRFIFALGVLCSLQCISFAATETGGIQFEYNPPPAKSESDLFVAILEPTTGTNVTVAQFMHHLKHTTYATAFMTEIFTLGIGTHLFTDDIMEKPSEEERRIAYVAGKLWSSLTGMRAINRLALRVSNETALRYLRHEERNTTLQYMFSKLSAAILSNPRLNEKYVDEMESLDLSILPPLDYININMTKFGSIERTLIKKVWPAEKSFHLIAHARFSQHLETRVEDANEFDFDNVLIAHLLVDAASVPELTKEVQNAYSEAVENVVKVSAGYLKKTRIYDQFDIALFKSIEANLGYYQNVVYKMIELRNNYPQAPSFEV